MRGFIPNESVPMPPLPRQVSWVTLNDDPNAPDPIAFIGVNNGDDTCEKIPRAIAINRMLDDYERYETKVAGESVDIVLAMSLSGVHFLSTSRDPNQPNLLLKLPSCPD